LSSQFGNIVEDEISLTNAISHQIERSEVTVIVPTLNEEESIGFVLQNLQIEGFSKILIVDGNSIDNTVTNAKNFGVEIIQQKGKGKAGAIKTAFEVIKTPYLVIIDGDSTYNPSEIDRLLDKASVYNQVIGARKDRVNIKRLNRFGNNIINTVFNVFFGTDLQDVCSGMYCLKTDFAKNMPLYSDGFDIEVEIAANCSNSNSIKEVPISYNKRIGIQKLNSFRDGFKIISAILNLGRQFNPIVFYSFLMAGLLAIPGLGILVVSITPTINRYSSPELGVFGSLFITTGIQFLILAIVVSQIKHVIRYYNLNQLEKKREPNYF
jgi:dolichol-phosphate mannosyltransferase